MHQKHVSAPGDPTLPGTRSWRIIELPGATANIRVRGAEALRQLRTIEGDRAHG